MNYLGLFNTLKSEIPNLQLIDKGFGTGLAVFTDRYPEGISLEQNLKEEFVITTVDGFYNYHHDNIKAINFFVAKAKQDPAT